MKAGVSREAKRVRKAMMKNILVWLFAPYSLLLALSVPVQAQQPAKIPRIGYLTADPLPLSRRTGTHFARDYASLGMSKEKTLSSSGELVRENRITSSRSRPNWRASRWTLSSGVVSYLYARPGRRPPLSPLSWSMVVMLLAAVLSPI